MSKALRIVFMGTPDFALPSLEMLLNQGYDIPLVITAADKPAGRGLKKRPSPVKSFAIDHQLEVWQPQNLKDTLFHSALRQINADLFIVVAFRILPKAVLEIPRIGSINLHASLLPQYRGAAPINWAIINGEKETGVSTFFIKPKVDTGDILMQEKTSIDIHENSEQLHDRLMMIGAKTLLKTLRLIESGQFKPVPQQETGAYKPAPKIYRDLGLLKPSMHAMDAYNLIRGLYPYPACYFEHRGKQIKIFETALPSNHPSQENFIFKENGKLYLQFDDAVLEVITLQVQGKKRMPAAEFIKGFRF